MYSVKIDERQFEEALKRHEDAFEKELEQIQVDEKELKKMILKMKKSLLEQTRLNNNTYNHACDSIQTVNRMHSRMDGFERKQVDLENSLERISNKLDLCIKTFEESVKIMSQGNLQISYPQKLWRFFKSLWMK